LIDENIKWYGKALTSSRTLQGSYTNLYKNDSIDPVVDEFKVSAKKVDHLFLVKRIFKIRFLELFPSLQIGKTLLL
jgi:hypothetical protein